MRKYIAIIVALVFVCTVAIIGCEKKPEAPSPTSQPIVNPTPPAPAPVAAPPAHAPAPAKPAKK